MENKSHQINRNDKSSSLSREIHQVSDGAEGLLPNRQDPDIFEHRNQNQKSNNLGVANSDAVFIGWQKTPSGEVFPLYNVIVKNHPLYHSTVSDQTLYKQNLKIPQTPPPQGNVKRFDDEK